MISEKSAKKKVCRNSGYAELFHDTFGDSYEFINKIISVSDKVFELKKDKKTVSGICTFEVGIKYGGSLLKGAYIYGAATDKEYRTHGYFSKICREVYDFYASRSFDFLMTVPASKQLFSLYEHMGFDVRANGVISLCSDKTSVILPEECEFFEFDGDFDRLYSLHLENDILIKSKEVFIVSVSDLKIKYIRNKSDCGYALFDGGKMVFASLCGTKYESAEKACFRFIGEKKALPEGLLCDILFEI
ncbi:MAG: GNAT family N-acetyltransferase [Eubacteriales bacterium]